MHFNENPILFIALCLIGLPMAILIIMFYGAVLLLNCLIQAMHSREEKSIA